VISISCLNVWRLCVPNIMSSVACLKKFTSLMLAHAYSVKIGVIFRRSVWKTKCWQKSKPTWKLKHANFILETFEYFCQKSSKSMSTIIVDIDFDDWAIPFQVGVGAFFETQSGLATSMQLVRLVGCGLNVNANAMVDMIVNKGQRHSFYTTSYIGCQ